VVSPLTLAYSCGPDEIQTDFTVPLTGAAIWSLPARGAGDFIFSMTDGAHTIGGMTRVKAALDAAIETDGAGQLAPWVFHDLRRALATWLSDRGVDYVIADLCLTHAIPLGRSGSTYQRSYKIVEPPPGARSVEHPSRSRGRGERAQGTAAAGSRT
jgi:hypothetical protein